MMQVVFDIMSNFNDENNKSSTCFWNLFFSHHFLSKFDLDFQFKLFACTYVVNEKRCILNVNLRSKSLILFLPKLFEIIKVKDNQSKHLYCCAEHRNLFKYQHINSNYDRNDNISNETELLSHVIKLISAFLYSYRGLIDKLLDFMCGEFSPCVLKNLLGIF